MADWLPDGLRFNSAALEVFEVFEVIEVIEVISNINSAACSDPPRDSVLSARVGALGGTGSVSTSMSWVQTDHY